MDVARSVRPRRGRPRKFLEPSRAVTLTLPKDVVSALAAIDTDLSRAVVRLAQPELAKRPHPAAELAVFGRRAVIVVNPTRTLEERTGVSLIPLSDGRALISFEQPTTIAQLELRLQDAVDDHRLPAEDQRIFEAIADILRTARRSPDVALQQRNIIILEAARPAVLRATPGATETPGSPRRRGRTLKASNKFLVLAAAALLTASCGDKKPTAPAPLPDPHVTAPLALSPSDGEQTSTLRPTLTVQNGTTDQQGGSRTYEFQVSDKSDFSAAVTTQVAGYAVVVSKTGVPEGADGKTTFTPDQDLQPTTRYYWRARMVQGNVTSEWSSTRKFNSKLAGFIRGGELYDPLIHNETVGERVGSTEFIPGKGIRLNDSTSLVRYLLPQTVTSGEFSMEVEGLQANAPGNKSKVFGMQEGQGDFITNRYRVDAQYRGVAGGPPNCIQWRAMFGSDDEKLEPDTSVRYASVFMLNPARAYFWRATWTNSGFRLEVLDGGIAGAPMYNQAVMDETVSYSPNPHYAYLGAPVGRSGAESASIPGAIYRNVWLGNRPRPASLGTALQSAR